MAVALAVVAIPVVGARVSTAGTVALAAEAATAAATARTEAAETSAARGVVKIATLIAVCDGIGPRRLQVGAEKQKSKGDE